MRLEHLLSGDLEIDKYLLVSLLTSFIGGLAQLARSLAWHARGHRFDSDILHAQAFA